MTQQQIKNIFFICLSMLIFFIDLCMFGFLQQHLILPLHCFIVLLMAKYSEHKTMLPLFLLCLLAYLDTNMFGACLLYILPTLLLAKYCKEHLQITCIIPYLLLVASLCLKKIIFYYVCTMNVSWYNFAISIALNFFILAIFIIINHQIEKN